MSAFNNSNDQGQFTSSSGNTPSDEMLLDAIAGGAVWAMESLYQRYSRLLYSLVYRMVAVHQVSEDLIQESFLAIWRRAQSYSPQTGTARNWLISIVHHRTIDYLRAVRRRSVMKEVPMDNTEVDEQTSFPDVWEEAWRSVQSAQVRAALMQIPTEQRMVIELAYFQGWTHSEIAEGCQIPLGTVKARMRLGLQHMKRALGQMGINEL
ncbi:MAG: sigma-70 family RNA polymerase sigma factor [Ktedonobacteraceae bacterium]